MSTGALLLMQDPQPVSEPEITFNKPINGHVLKRLIEAGLTWLKTNHQIVNSLNVFPVPDGDTGTNMVLTMQSAYDEIKDLNERNFGKVAHAVAHGALMGARGNSGVILSQLWRGFARAIDNIDTPDVGELAHAFVEARDTAYKGVVRPVEGTILTVSKDMASAAEKAHLSTAHPIKLLEIVVDAADQSVQHTPELLPVLKDAGVVDAGGKGLYFILEGMLRYLKGDTLETAVGSVRPLSEITLQHTREVIEPGQDYEVVVDFQPSYTLDLTGFYNQLEQMGTSIQLGEGDGMYRLHIHVPTQNLYSPIDLTRSLGTVTKIAVENLMEQMGVNEERCDEAQPTIAPIVPGQIAVVAVAPGAGIARVFASLGVAAIVEGGQTMNPSTQMIVQSFEDLPTDKIVILPNNKNIILAARAAAEVTDKRVAIVPSCSVPQGLAAVMRLIPDGDYDRVLEEMNAALSEVQTGEITSATRSVEIDGVEVNEGEIIALHDGKLVLAAPNIEEAVLGFLEKSHAEDFELITLFYGIDISNNQAKGIAASISTRYPNQEVEVQQGCQPHYPFIISIE
jgi:DAK2 domain fusion protein YloV